jgi:putative heme-binding domain-containing protein
LRRAGTDAALRGVVTSGIPGSGMPGFRLDPDDLRALVAFVRVGLDAGTNGPTVALGDGGRGRAVFEGDGNCLTCHRVGDRGAYVGPDLTEIGRLRTPAAIQRSLLDPTASMRPINRPVEAITNTGRVVKGRRLNEDSYTVQIQDDHGRLVSLVKADLRQLTVATTSPMPPYGDKLTAAAIADLIAYLMTLNGSQP